MAGCVGLGTIAEPSRPAAEVFAEIEVRTAGSEVVEFVLTSGVVNRAQRELTRGDVVKQVPRALTTRSELNEHQLQLLRLVTIRGAR